MAFNQNKYIQEYVKKHKKQFKVNLNIDEHKKLKEDTKGYL